jgi:hypothetical protein
MTVTTTLNLWNIDDGLKVMEEMIKKDDYEYADNVRYARSWMPQEVEEYHRKRESGCCGYYDVILDGSQGQIFFGFNYGH